jgi:hypothetical protein
MFYMGNPLANLHMCTVRPSQKNLCEGYYCHDRNFCHRLWSGVPLISAAAVDDGEFWKARFKQLFFLPATAVGTWVGSVSEILQAEHCA